MMHEQFCCNHQIIAATGLRPAGSPLSTACEESVRVILRREAKELLVEARPQALKNRRHIHWNTLRIFSR